MSSDKTTIDPNWHHVSLEGLACPRCKSKGDDEVGGVFLVIPDELLSEVESGIIPRGHHLILCYACALEILAKAGANMLVGEISNFAKSLGNRGRSKHLP